MDRRADEGRESFQSPVTAPFLHAKALQLLPWYTLTEDDISLYHFNTTSICSIMHNNEKNFDLERKKVLIQWWLDQPNHTEVLANYGVLIRFV